ncbi:hypothetical protein TMU3MR103_0644 [Tetragenococcus muriaticus 3MR10-3]|uniref:BppU N-terminal domain-containing protein n=1 Tax=Tetragenococcus muriaticus 3MR10-3 TaxID=1302648 RepID=A0A091CDJ3_9ENTE|nr:hypothetical protein TMU3MR103_0644 [Tetragenococcus muriaticus 3MR10-3]
MVMILNDDNGKQFIPGDNEIEVLSAIQGTAEYVLPDNLLGYEGKVTSYVYLDFSDGTHTDEGRFTFEIKRSLVTDVIPKAGDKYVKDFEDVKAEVQKAADGTIKTASEAGKSIDEASKEVNTAKAEAIKNMHELDISDKNYLLDSKKRVLNPRTSGGASDNSNHTIYHLSEPIPAGAEMTISGKLEITDGAFDNISILFRDENDVSGGHSLMKISDNEFSKTFTLSKTLHKIYIYAGESDKTRGNGVVYTDVKLQPGSLATPWNPNPHEIMTHISDKNYLLDSKKKVIKPRTSGEVSDTTNHTVYHLSEPMPAGAEMTISGKLEITDGDFDAISIYYRGENGISLGHSLMKISDNEFSKTFTLPKALHKIYIYAGESGETRGNGVVYTDVKLQTGSLAAPWNPNPSEIVTQDQYNKLVNAVINLGGEI